MASGDPYTTLTNTLRSLAYAHFYLTGMTIPYYVLAAGDDVVYLTDSQEHAANIRDAVLASTSRTPDQPSPLGQVVKDCTAGPLHTFDFCSKWAFATAEGMVLTRDFNKLFTTK